MKISRDYVGIAGIAAKTEAREVLAYLNVIKDENSPTGACIVAADGFMLACVPCTLEEGETPGLLDVGTFSKVVKATPKRIGEITFSLGDEAVTHDRVSYPRYRSPDHKDLQFPDFKRIIPLDVKQGLKGTRAYPVAINHELLYALGKALGGVGITIWCNPAGRYSPIVVTPVAGASGIRSMDFCSESLPKMPYGVLMSMHMARGDEGDKDFDDVTIKREEAVPV